MVAVATDNRWRMCYCKVVNEAMKDTRVTCVMSSPD